MTATKKEVSAMQQAYLEAAVWTEEDGLEDNTGFSEATIQRANTDCQQFLNTALASWPDVLTHWTPDQLGHDYWLTRNGHGTGFWDRYNAGRGEDLGNLLTGLCQYKPVDLYVGDDNQLYFS